MTNAVTIAQGGSAGITSEFKNLVINGNMRVNQRGGLTTINTGSGAVYPVDRMLVVMNSGISGTVGTAVQVSVTDSTVPHDFAIRVTNTVTLTGRTSFDSRIQHNFEGNNVYDVQVGNSNATPFSASFWVRGSKAGRAVYLFWCDNTGVGVYFRKTVNITTSWQYITIAIPPCTVSGAAIFRDNRRGFGSGLYWAGASRTTNDGAWQTAATEVNTNIDDWATAGDWIEFTGYQVERGTSPTTFEVRSYTVELQLCQRYYWQDITNNLGVWHSAWMDGNGAYPGVFLTFPVAMRTAPSGSFLYISSYYYNNGGVTNFVPAGGSVAFSSPSTTEGLLQLQGISNGVGAAQDQKAGQWYCKVACSADL